MPFLIQYYIVLGFRMFSAYFYFFYTIISILYRYTNYIVLYYLFAFNTYRRIQKISVSPRMTGVLTITRHNIYIYIYVCRAVFHCGWNKMHLDILYIYMLLLYCVVYMCVGRSVRCCVSKNRGTHIYTNGLLYVIYIPTDCVSHKSLMN